MTHAEERKQFLAMLVAEFPHRPRSLVIAMGRNLMARATTAQRLSELFCSVEMSEAETARQERKDEVNDAAIEAICKAWGLKARLDGDPRGYVVKLLLPSGRHNTWGGAECGWGVPAKGYSATELTRMMQWSR